MNSEIKYSRVCTAELVEFPRLLEAAVRADGQIRDDQNVNKQIPVIYFESHVTMPYLPVDRLCSHSVVITHTSCPKIPRQNSMLLFA